MTTQAQPTEERLSKLEGVYEQVNERLRDLTQGQDSLRAETNERFNDLAQAVRDVDANLRAEIRQTALRAETDARFNELTQGQEALREEIRQGDAALREEIRQGDAAIREEMNSRFSEMNARFNILLVLIGGVWATMIGGFIALFTRL